MQKPLFATLLGLTLLAQAALADSTIVILRHGEKPAAGLGQLNCQGLNRALALPPLLLQRFGKPDRLFAPNPSIQKADHGVPYAYIRPLATIEPLAIQVGMPVDVSWAMTDTDGLAGKLLVSLQDDASAPVFDPDAPAETGPRGVGAGALTDPEHVLLIGWNHRGEHLVRALDRRLPPGSRVSVVTSAPDGPELRLPNIGTVAVQRVDGVQRWLDTTRSELGCDHAIVLGDDRLPPAASDANVLLTLLALRPPRSGSDKPDTVVAELRQRPNRYLASQRFSDDLIVGDALIAMLLAQFAADPNLTEVIEELISPSSTHPLEIRLMPMSGGTSSAGLSFRSVQADLRARDGSIALGYRIVHHCDSDAEHQRSELHLNPDGDDPMPERDDTRVELVVLTRCDRHVDLTPAIATPTRGRAQV